MVTEPSPMFLDFLTWIVLPLMLAAVFAGLLAESDAIAEGQKPKEFNFDAAPTAEKPERPERSRKSRNRDLERRPESGGRPDIEDLPVI